jgi:hypothetical protein
MIPTMLLFGTFCGLFRIGGLSPPTVASIVAAGSVAWGVLVAVISTSWAVFFGGAALGLANASVGVAVVSAISWPVRRHRSTPG